MSNAQCGAVSRDTVKSFLHNSFGFGVQTAGRFVKKEDAWLRYDAAGDSNALLLAAGKSGGAFFEDSVIALSSVSIAAFSTENTFGPYFWSGHDKLMCIGIFASFYYKPHLFFFWQRHKLGSFHAMRDIFKDRSAE